MSKRALKKSKRRSKAVLPALGLTGLSLSLASGATASTGEVTTNLPSTTQPHELFLGEEEISDVSLSTFYVFDKENAAQPKLGEKVAWGCGCRGCRCGGCRCGWRGSVLPLVLNRTPGGGSGAAAVFAARGATAPKQCRDGRRKSLEQIFRGRTRSSVGQRSYSRSYSKCKRALLVVVRTMKQASCSSTDHGGGGSMSCCGTLTKFA